MYGFILQMHAKFAKSAITIPKNSPRKISMLVYKNEEFYAYFKFDDTDFKKCPLKNIAE
jgi:hypothetical protein